MKTPAGVTALLFIHSRRPSTTLRVSIWFWQNCSRSVCTIPFAEASRPSGQKAGGGFCSVGNFCSLKELRNSELHGSYMQLIRKTGGAIDWSVWWNLLSISVKKIRGLRLQVLVFGDFVLGSLFSGSIHFLKLNINLRSDYAIDMSITRLIIESNVINKLNFEILSYVCCCYLHIVLYQLEPITRFNVRSKSHARLVGEKEGNKNERKVREMVAYCTNWTMAWHRSCICTLTKHVVSANHRVIHRNVIITINNCHVRYKWQPRHNANVIPLLL